MSAFNSVSFWSRLWACAVSWRTALPNSAANSRSAATDCSTGLVWAFQKASRPRTASNSAATASRVADNSLNRALSGARAAWFVSRRLLQLTSVMDEDAGRLPKRRVVGSAWPGRIRTQD